MFLNCGVGEDSLESPLDCKEFQPVHPKGNQSWIFTGRTDAWSYNSNTLATWCEELTHWKRPWCWERWRREEKGTTEDEIVGWHHRLNAHEFERALGIGDRRRSLACCSPWGCKELDTTKRLNWSEGKIPHLMNLVTMSIWKLM